MRPRGTAWRRLDAVRSSWSPRSAAPRGSQAAAAALACAGSEPDRAALLSTSAGRRRGRPWSPRRRRASWRSGSPPTCRRLRSPRAGRSATSRSRRRAERLRGGLGGAAARPRARSRSSTCRRPVAAVLRPRPASRPTGALLRADLAADRRCWRWPSRDLLGRGLRGRGPQAPLGWVAAAPAPVRRLAPGARRPAASRRTKRCSGRVTTVTQIGTATIGRGSTAPR